MAARASGSKKKAKASASPGAPTASAGDFHVVTGGRAWIAVPREGFALGRTLDAFLAFVVRRFPLTVAPPDVVEPESVTGYDDALGKAHRALHTFLCERGWRVPKPIREAHARAAAVTPWTLGSVLVGDTKRRALERASELERRVKVLRDLLGKYRPPSSRDVFAKDLAGRARLNELVLELIRQAVAALPADPAAELLRPASGAYEVLELVPNVKYPGALDEAAKVWSERTGAQLPQSKAILTKGISPWW